LVQQEPAQEEAAQPEQVLLEQAHQVEQVLLEELGVREAVAACKCRL